jgi:hypothetical protein
MTNTMVVDHETEAQLAADAGHQIGCMEEWMETALEAGADWIEQTGNGFKGRKYGACTCTIDEAGGMLITDAIKALEKLGYKVTK